MTNTMMDNEISRAVADLGGRVKTLPADKVALLTETATLDMSEWLALGDLASRAMLAGIISQDGAQALHGIHTRFHDGATLAERLVFIQVAGEIMTRLR